LNCGARDSARRSPGPSVHEDGGLCSAAAPRLLQPLPFLVEFLRLRRLERLEKVAIMGGRIWPPRIHRFVEETAEVACLEQTPHMI